MKIFSRFIIRYDLLYIINYNYELYLQYVFLSFSLYQTSLVIKTVFVKFKSGFFVEFCWLTRRKLWRSRQSKDRIAGNYWVGRIEFAESSQSLISDWCSTWIQISRIYSATFRVNRRRRRRICFWWNERGINRKKKNQF